MRERLQAQISSPGVGDDDLARAVNSAPRLVRRSRMLERLADELASGRPGPAYSLLADGDRLIAQGRRTLVFNDQRLLLLDETANPEILREFVRQLQDLPEIRVRRNARVIQVRDFTFYGHDLAELAPASEGWALWRPKARLAVVAEFIAGVARAGRTLVVTTKRVRCALTGEDSRASLPVSVPYTGADLAHFGNIRGTKEFEEHDTVIILGWEQPCVRDAEQRAMAIWYDTKEPIRSIVPDAKGRVQYPERMRPYRMRDGSRRRGRVNIHPDRRVQAVVEQVREAEIVQAIDRLRLIDSPQRKTVFILCNIPLSIPIDDLVTWRELVGDGRLERALETCDENGWEALPLAAAELSRLFPELWGTETAAADWLGKNPPNPDTPLIRHWGVIGVYRRKRRSGRWSKALVRHGVDPMVALAAVLEVASEDLQLRDPQDADSDDVAR